MANQENRTPNQDMRREPEQQAQAKDSKPSQSAKVRKDQPAPRQQPDQNAGTRH